MLSNPYGIPAAEFPLFGSVLREDFRPDSDRDDAHVLDMLLAARKVAEAVENVTYDEFQADWKAQSAVEHQLMILGEAV